MKILKALSIAGVAFYTVGCTHMTSNYGASPDNVDEIRKSGITELSVGEFVSKNSDTTSITCRAAGPVKNQNNVSFENYIEGAIKNDLKMAGVYKEGSDIKISGAIEKLDFNSNIGAGKWMINAKISSPKSQGYTVQSTYDFSTNFVADKACQQVAQAYEPAVENFINQIVTHPGFSSLAK
ncbi:hypothetical protein [Marinobacterium weihaiense]|uniref:Lipoprotein n=1 Tax=Marinobacterium weihaiense TaxID=2851016 RepID=A0ABS6MEJ2_9GAMM|nr:hypothetical protein [Marinobacterium weihaiense]MBV0934709.1 hypothetical protein [Marinobacterium weihaiense]